MEERSEQERIQALVETASSGDPSIDDDDVLVKLASFEEADRIEKGSVEKGSVLAF